MGNICKWFFQLDHEANLYEWEMNVFLGGNCFKNSIYQLIQSDAFYSLVRGHQQPFKLVCMYTYILYIPGNSADDFFQGFRENNYPFKGLVFSEMTNKKQDNKIKDLENLGKVPIFFQATVAVAGFPPGSTRSSAKPPKVG